MAASPPCCRRGTVGARLAFTDDLPERIDRIGRADPAERAEIDHAARLRPREGVNIAGCRLALPDDAPEIVHGEGRAVSAAERAQINDAAGRRPGERVTVAAGREARANHLPRAVDRVHDAPV